MSSLEKGSAATSVSSCSTVYGGEVRSRGEIGWRTRGGGAHCEATTTAMAARLAARSSRGMDASTDEWSTEMGGTARDVLRRKRGVGDEMGAAHRAVPL
jgi:hypothetical protein